MQSADRLPGVDPHDGKLKWYQGDSFTLCFPIEMMLVDCKGTRVPYVLYPTDVVKTRFKTKMEKDLIHEFVNTNIKNNMVELEFTPEISRKFCKGDYIIEMKLIADQNNFYVPVATDFEPMDMVRIDTKSKFSGQNIVVKNTVIKESHEVEIEQPDVEVKPSESDNEHCVEIEDEDAVEIEQPDKDYTEKTIVLCDGVITKADNATVKEYAQLHSNYIIPLRVYVGQELFNNRISVELENYQYVYVDDIVDREGYIHLLVDGYNLVGYECTITLHSAFLKVVSYTIKVADTIGFQNVDLDYVEDINDVKAGNLVLGHRKTVDGLSDQDDIFGNITYTIRNNVKRALIPLNIRLGMEYSNKSVAVSANDGVKMSYTVSSLGVLKLILDTQDLTVKEFNIEISSDLGTVNRVINTEKVSDISVVYDKDNIPTDCRYVTRCMYNEKYTRCPNCPLKEKSMIPSIKTKTLIDECFNEVKVL